jgi:hypothetical protein
MELFKEEKNFSISVVAVKNNASYKSAEFRIRNPNPIYEEGRWRKLITTLRKVLLICTVNLNNGEKV